MLKRMIASFAVVLCSCVYGQDRATDWQEDIDFYAKNLVAKHIDPFHTLAKDSFHQEIKRIKQSTATASDSEIIVALMRLTHSINDGHTSFPLWGQEQAQFPIELKYLNNKLHLVGIGDQYKELLGAQLVSVNNQPAADVFKLISQLTPFSENEFSTGVRAASYFNNVNILSGLGIIADKSNADFAFEQNGVRRELKLKASTSPKIDLRISHLDDEVFSPKSQIDANLWFGSTADHKTIYIKFRRYTSMAKMDNFAESLLGFINKNKSENLIIDLRDNYGGDFFVGLKLAQWLVLADSINWKSGVYTLIDHVTFSAAMSNAAQYTQILNSKLVGEPSGAKPSGYQDMGQFSLPHSKFEVSYSKRLYHFKEDQRDALYPDQLIEISLDDYLNAHDRQLRWVLNALEQH